MPGRGRFRTLRLAATSIAVGGVAVFAWQACAIYDASLLLPYPAEASAPPPDVYVAPMVDSGIDAGCNSADPPARTNVDDPTDADTSSITYIAALRTFDLGLTSPVGGYNIDKTCTCPWAQSCAPFAASDQNCDSDGGSDNAAGKLLNEFNSAEHLIDQTTQNQLLAEGHYGLLFVLTDYNGTPNDSQVTAALYLTNGIEGVEDGGSPPAPKFDGTDVWTIDTSTIFGYPNVVLPNGTACSAATKTCAPKYFDGAAYVVDGVLVATLPYVFVSLAQTNGIGSLPATLTSARVTGKLRATSGGYAIDDGVVAARWATSDLLSDMQYLHLGSGYLCSSSDEYKVLKTEVCNAADIASDPDNDNSNPLVGCDALSVAVGYTAVPAKLGPVYSQTRTPPCGNAMDSCSQ